MYAGPGGGFATDTIEQTLLKSENAQVRYRPAKMVRAMAKYQLSEDLLFSRLKCELRRSYNQVKGWTA